MFNKIPMKQAQSNLLDSTREQLTGLSDALRSRTISVNADGVATTNVVSYDSETMVETSVTSSPAFGTRVARGVCGLVLEEETADETIAGIASSFNGNTVESIAYSYDALGRPVARNADAFGYNDRSEVTSASIMGWSPSPSTASYDYDGIGNLLQSTFNAATNAYTANGLNQYTSILCDSVTLCEPTYDTDGNMLSDGVLSFTYDAASRLKTVSSNGVTLVTNFYDAKSHRVKKVTPNATTTFFYDDWNLVEERIAYADNTSSTIRYYWGKDLSGTLQGAGGVGGLLWLTIDGVVYIPCYDNNGNVTRYLNANGGTFARYSYDAFGRLIAKAGRRSGFFRHRFSTKYFDTETGLYYYGYRFYHPPLMRWLNRDPIEENGGINLYIMSCNGLLQRYDLYGLVAPPIPMDDFFMDRKRRREFQISKFVDVRNYGQHVSGENYFVRVAFVARFTPPREIDNARYKQSPLSRAIFGDAGVSMGGESGMYEADEKYGDIDWTKWGRPRIIEEGKSIAGVSLGRRFVYDEKKFEFGYIAYILRDGESNWTVIDKNFDLYTTWIVGGLKSLLPDRDISFRDTINKCDVVMLFFGDAGFPPQSLRIAPSQNSLKGDE